jgi:hypothetical protein
MPRALRIGLLPATIGLMLTCTACDRPGPRPKTATPPQAQISETGAPPVAGTPAPEQASATPTPTGILPSPIAPAPTPDIEADQIDQLLGNLENAVGSSDDFPDLP